MLTSYTIKNFKSYQDATLPLSTVTFLIGANGSGKSNALEALRFIGWLGQGKRLDDIEREFTNPNSSVRGKSADLFLYGSKSFSMFFKTVAGKKYSLQLEIQNFSPADNDLGPFLINKFEQLSEDDRDIPLYKTYSDPQEHSDEISIQYNNFARGGKKPHIPCNNRQAVFYQLLSDNRFDSLRSKQEIPLATKFLREQFGNIIFLDPNPMQMRGYAHKSGDCRISENGSNVSAVLQTICKDTKQKSQLIEFIRSLPEQDIKDITFEETAFGDVMLALVESFSTSRTVPATLLSDGTLRVLAIAAALLGAPENALVVIEEIDNGIHPSRAKHLVNQMYAIAGSRKIQLLLTTHNPALMNAIPAKELGNVLCCFRDVQNGSSKIIQLGQLPRFIELATRGPLGEVVVSDFFEKVIKDTTSEDERQKKQMAWLDAFEQSVKNREE